MVPLAIVLGALAPRDPHPTPAQAGQHHLHHGRLANPGFATEQDELAGAVGRPLEALRDGLDFALASDEGPGVSGAGPPGRRPGETDSPAGRPWRDSAARPPHRPRPGESRAHSRAAPYR